MYQRFAMSGEPEAHKQEIGTHSGRAPEVNAGRPRKKGSAKVRCSPTACATRSINGNLGVSRFGSSHAHYTSPHARGRGRQSHGGYGAPLFPLRLIMQPKLSENTGRPSQ
jgi:hypothetical protein